MIVLTVARRFAKNLQIQVRQLYLEPTCGGAYMRAYAMRK